MSLTEQALLHMRPGRRRLVRARGPDGKSDGERPEAVVATAKAYRIKNGAIPTIALHEHYGSTIGQLLLEEAIQRHHYDTACRYAQIVLQNARLYGIPSPHPRALDLLAAFGGLSCAPDMPEDQINRIKGLFRDCRATLLETGRGLLVGSEVNRIVYGVVIENWPRNSLSRQDSQNLRCGLNALGRLFERYRP